MVITPLRSGARVTREHFTCPFCGWPSATKVGSHLHHIRSHGAGSKADRNWVIFYQYMEEGLTTSELAGIHEVSPATIRRIVQRGLLFPQVYDMDHGLGHPFPSAHPVTILKRSHV